MIMSHAGHIDITPELCPVTYPCPTCFSISICNHVLATLEMAEWSPRHTFTPAILDRNPVLSSRSKFKIQTNTSFVCGNGPNRLLSQGILRLTAIRILQASSWRQTTSHPMHCIIMVRKNPIRLAFMSLSSIVDTFHHIRSSALLNNWSL